MLVVMLRSADHSTRLVGALLWCGYLRYSATRAAVETFAEWLNDRSNPPGGPA
jgi:hypothetical protein